MINRMIIFFLAFAYSGPAPASHDDMSEIKACIESIYRSKSRDESIAQSKICLQQAAVAKERQPGLHVNALYITLFLTSHTLSGETSDYKRELTGHYHTLLVPYLEESIVEAFSSEVLTDVFDTLSYLIKFIPEDRQVKDASQVFMVLERRQHIATRQIQYMYSSLVTLRQFDKAREFAGAHQVPYEERLPDRVRVEAHFDENQAGLYEIEGNSLYLRNFNLPSFTGVVVVASPSCSYVKEAATLIENDAELSAYFQENSLWLARQGDLALTATREYNAIHHSLPIVLTYKRAYWARVEFDLTPGFHFISAGEVIKYLPHVDKEKIREALKAINLE